MGEFFDTYKKNKNPPNSYLCDNAIAWCVSYGNLYDITGCVICCAKCQFYPFLPASSITMPPSWKMLLV